MDDLAFDKAEKALRELETAYILDGWLHAARGIKALVELLHAIRHMVRSTAARARAL